MTCKFVFSRSSPLIKHFCCKTVATEPYFGYTRPDAHACVVFNEIMVNKIANDGSDHKYFLILIRHLWHNRP